MSFQSDRLAIIGTGLINGSLALALKEAGKIRTAHKGQAIALLRLDDLAKGRLTVSGVEATPRQPDWWPAAEEA